MRKIASIALIVLTSVSWCFGVLQSNTTIIEAQNGSIERQSYNTIVADSTANKALDKKNRPPKESPDGVKGLGIEQVKTMLKKLGYTQPGPYKNHANVTKSGYSFYITFLDLNKHKPTERLKDEYDFKTYKVSWEHGPAEEFLSVVRVTLSKNETYIIYFKKI